MSEDPPVRRFSEINALLGALCGWYVLGSRSPDRYASAIAHGLTGVVATVFWVMFVHAGYKMIEFSLRKRYDDPIEAVTAVFEIAAKDAQVVGTFEVLATLIVGGLLSGYVATWVGRRYS